MHRPLLSVDRSAGSSSSAKHYLIPVDDTDDSEDVGAGMRAVPSLPQQCSLYCFCGNVELGKSVGLRRLCTLPWGEARSPALVANLRCRPSTGQSKCLAAARCSTCCTWCPSRRCLLVMG